MKAWRVICDECKKETLLKNAAVIQKCIFCDYLFSFIAYKKVWLYEDYIYYDINECYLKKK